MSYASAHLLVRQELTRNDLDFAGGGHNPVNPRLGEGVKLLVLPGHTSNWPAAILTRPAHELRLEQVATATVVLELALRHRGDLAEDDKSKAT